MTRLLLVRHGETPWNREGRWQGQADVPLNARGWLQAAMLAHGLRSQRIAAVYTSTLQRARRTAQAVAICLAVPLVVDDRLKEINLGEWEGLLSTDIRDRNPGLFEQWGAAPDTVRPPGGESVSDLETRVVAALHDIQRRWPGAIVCLVGHKATNAVIRSYALGLPMAETMSGEPQHAVWEAVDLPEPPTTGRASGATEDQ